MDNSNEDLDLALEYLLEEEGGWSNHPADRGGATMFGITQVVYDSWRYKHNNSKQSVGKITKQEAREIYKSGYWDAAGCNKLAWPISYLTFDAAVNSGVARAVQWTQDGLGLTVDGKIGSLSSARSQEVVQNGEAGALLAIVDKRVQFLARLVMRNPSQGVFLLGWWRRTQRVLVRSLLTTDKE